MKELFIKQMNEEMEQGYHIERAALYYGHEPKPVEINITCPNCMEKKLEFYTTNDIKCSGNGCGQEYILINANTVKFK